MSRLLKSRVENIDGQELARVQDLLIHPQNGRTAYAVLATGGFLGLGKRLKAVPALALSSGTTKKRVVAVDISKTGWEEAPALKGAAEVVLTNHILAGSINRYYALAEETNHVAVASPGTDSGSMPLLKPTGREATELVQGPKATLESVRGFIGQRIGDREHNRLGKIHDLLLDVSGRGAGYAIVSADIVPNSGNFAVPLQLLHATDHHGFTLDANRNIFEQAPSFDVVSWHRHQLSSGTIFRFGKGQ